MRFQIRRLRADTYEVGQSMGGRRDAAEFLDTDDSCFSCKPMTSYVVRYEGLHAPDWVSERLHDIDTRLSAVEKSASQCAAGHATEANGLGINLGEVRWLLTLLVHRDATVKRVEELWEQLHARQHGTMRELKLAAELRSALSA